MRVVVLNNFFFQAEDGIRDLVRSRGLGDVYKRQILHCANHATHHRSEIAATLTELGHEPPSSDLLELSLIHI
mgnify:CR=1 FL=1